MSATATTATTCPICVDATLRTGTKRSHMGAIVQPHYRDGAGCPSCHTSACYTCWFTHYKVQATDGKDWACMFCLEAVTYQDIQAAVSKPQFAKIKAARGELLFLRDSVHHSTMDEVLAIHTRLGTEFMPRSRVDELYRRAHVLEFHHNPTIASIVCANAVCGARLDPAPNCTVVDCVTCEASTCVRCTERVLDEGHECDDDTVASVATVRSNSVPCPNCKSHVYKIEGCDQMFCTSCKACMFSYSTGKPIVGGFVHNPHYSEYLDGGGKRLKMDGSGGRRGLEITEAIENIISPVNASRSRRVAEFLIDLSLTYLAAAREAPPRALRLARRWYLGSARDAAAAARYRTKLVQLDMKREFIERAIQLLETFYHRVSDHLETHHDPALDTVSRSLHVVDAQVHVTRASLRDLLDEYGYEPIVQFDIGMIHVPAISTLVLSI